MLRKKALAGEGFVTFLTFVRQNTGVCDTDVYLQIRLRAEIFVALVARKVFDALMDYSDMSL